MGIYLVYTVAGATRAGVSTTNKSLNVYITFTVQGPGNQGQLWRLCTVDR